MDVCQERSRALVVWIYDLVDALGEIVEKSVYKVHVLWDVTPTQDVSLLRKGIRGRIIRKHETAGTRCFAIGTSDMETQNK